MASPHAKTQASPNPRIFRRLLLIATTVSILSTVAFILYVFLPHFTQVQPTQRRLLYLVGLIGLAVAEACQLLGILALIGRWASHYNTERRLREILVLIISLVPYVVIAIFLYTLYTYLRARRQDPASEQTSQAKQELKEQAVDTVIGQGANRSSSLAGSQPQGAPSSSLSAAPAAAARPTLRDTVGKVVGPSTQGGLSDAGNRLVALTMIGLALSTVVTLGVVVPAGGLAALQSAPQLASSYQGTAHNTTLNLGSPFKLTVTSQDAQGNIRGQVTFTPPLYGDGPFTGTVSSAGRLQLTVVSTPNNPCQCTSINLTGTVGPQGTLSGTYIAYTRTGVQKGAWQARPI